MLQLAGVVASAAMVAWPERHTQATFTYQPCGQEAWKLLVRLEDPFQDLETFKNLASIARHLGLSRQRFYVRECKPESQRERPHHWSDGVYYRDDSPAVILGKLGR